MNVRYLPSIHYKKNCFSTSNAHLFWHSSCKDMPPSWWSIKANYSLPRRLRPKEDAWHVFCHRRSQDPGIPKLADVLFFLYVFVLVFCAFLFCYHICTFLFVFWHIFCLTWFQDLGIPKLVAVFSQAAPHKQQLIGTNISWATGVFQTKHSCLNKFNKSRNSYYSVLFREVVPKPVIIS